MWAPRLFIAASQLAPLIPLAVALVHFRFLDRALKLIALMIFLSACTEALGEYVVSGGASNLWIFHIWTPLEFTLIILAFACWQRSGRVRGLLYRAIPLFLLVMVVNKIFFEPLTSLDSISRSIGSTILVGVAVFTFQRIIIEPGDSLTRDPRFWVASAVLIYHAGTLTLFTLARLMLSDNPATFGTVYSVHTVINIFTNLLYAAAFLCARNTK